MSALIRKFLGKLFPHEKQDISIGSEVILFDITRVDNQRNKPKETVLLLLTIILLTLIPTVNTNATGVIFSGTTYQNLSNASTIVQPRQYKDFIHMPELVWNDEVFYCAFCYFNNSVLMISDVVRHVGFKTQRRTVAGCQVAILNSPTASKAVYEITQQLRKNKGEQLFGKGTVSQYANMQYSNKMQIIFISFKRPIGDYKMIGFDVYYPRTSTSYSNIFSIWPTFVYPNNTKPLFVYSNESIAEEQHHVAISVSPVVDNNNNMAIIRPIQHQTEQQLNCPTCASTNCTNSDQPKDALIIDKTTASVVALLIMVIFVLLTFHVCRNVMGRQQRGYQQVQNPKQSYY